MVFLDEYCLTYSEVGLVVCGYLPCIYYKILLLLL